MGCLKLTYNQQDTPLKVVYRKTEPQQKGVQRFLSVDPIIKSFESPYAYCHNHPVRFIDPNGMDPDPPIRPRKYRKLIQKFEENGNQKTGERLANYINKNSESLQRKNARYDGKSNTVQFDFQKSIRPAKNRIYRQQNGVTTLPEVTLVSGCIRGGVKDPNMVPPSGDKFYNSDGTLFFNMNTTGMTNRVFILNPTFNNNDYNTLQQRAEQTGDNSTVNGYMRLHSTEYDFFDPLKSYKNVLVYQNLSGGEWFMMFGTMMGEGFAAGYRSGQTYHRNPGLSKHYSQVNGAKGYWTDRVQTEKFEPWW